MNEPACFDCVYFVPFSSWHNHLTEEQWNEGLEGECRRHVPHLGEELTDRHGDTFRHFGEWPKVMACNWCGEFISRHRQGPDSRRPEQNPCPSPDAVCGNNQKCGKCKGNGAAVAATTKPE